MGKIGNGVDFSSGVILAAGIADFDDRIAESFEGIGGIGSSAGNTGAVIIGCR